MAASGMTPAEVIEFARAQGVKIVDLKFTDLPGTFQHFSIPLSGLSEDVFEQGLGFDGSSIRGFQEINESDMMMVPDSTSAFIDPIYNIPTLSLICDVRDPVSESDYTRDPRYVARKAEEFLKSTGTADTSYWGPELEHFIFDNVRFDQNEHSGYYFIDSEEGIWNSGSNEVPNLGHRPGYKQGYFPTPPVDTLQDLRSEMILKMMDCGIEIEVHHHEVATAGQGEIDMRYDTLTRMADQVMLHKYIVKNVARAHGKSATFMPKPLFADNGSGMHTHQSLWRDEVPLFYDAQGYGLMSEMGLNYIGGLFKHASALMAFCAPTTNSYRRLVPGFEAPVNLVYSQRNRSAAARIPVYTKEPAAKRIEFRSPDPSCNPYLAFAAMLMAGLDGIINKLDPGDPLDVDLYDLSPEQAAQVQQVPGSLDESLDALEEDHEFLLRGDVFTSDVIETWLHYKRTEELDEVRLRPHPYEFALYYNA